MAARFSSRAAICTVNNIALLITEGCHLAHNDRNIIFRIFQCSVTQRYFKIFSDFNFIVKDLEDPVLLYPFDLLPRAVKFRKVARHSSVTAVSIIAQARVSHRVNHSVLSLFKLLRRTRDSGRECILFSDKAREHTLRGQCGKPVVRLLIVPCNSTAAGRRAVRVVYPYTGWSPKNVALFDEDM